MTADEIRRTILARLKAVVGSCNRTHLDHNDGVFRGLLWALTGVDHGCYLLRDVPRLLALAGIPCRVEDDELVHATPDDPDWPA